MSVTTFSPITLAVETGIREIKPASAGIGTGQRFTAGRNAKGRFASWDAIRLTVTARGHWYRSDDPRDEFSNDTVCRGCLGHGHFDYILDYRPCGRPATEQDIKATLAARPLTVALVARRDA